MHRLWKTLSALSGGGGGGEGAHQVHRPIECTIQAGHQSAQRFARGTVAARRRRTVHEGRLLRLSAAPNEREC